MKHKRSAGRVFRSLPLVLGLMMSAPIAVSQISLAQRLQQPVPGSVVPHAESATSPTTIEAALLALSSQAGIIFAGEVAAIHHREGCVETEWRIEEGMLGVSTGGTFVQREWSGLWVDDDRFHVGQRALVMLHRPSVAGFTSPVGGMDGVLPIAGDAVNGVVDLRWIAARVGRAAATPTGGTTALKTMGEVVAPVNEGTAGTTGSAGTMVSVDRIDRSLVVGLLRSSARTSAIARDSLR